VTCVGKVKVNVDSYGMLVGQMKVIVMRVKVYTVKFEGANVTAKFVIAVYVILKAARLDSTLLVTTLEL
jgi:hypothetical protein